MSVKILGKRSGIQYKGVEDRSELDPRPMMLNTLIIGQFRRGRLDKPMLVTSANIRKQLGYDPKNSDYVAVEDALNNGAPYVWVMRKLAPALGCNVESYFYTNTKPFMEYMPTTTFVADCTLNNQGVITEHSISIDIGTGDTGDTSKFIAFIDNIMYQLEIKLGINKAGYTLFHVDRIYPEEGLSDNIEYTIKNGEGLVEKRNICITFNTATLQGFEYGVLEYIFPDMPAPYTIQTKGYDPTLRDTVV